MAKITLNENAPSDLKTIFLGNATLDFSKGQTVESEDYNTVSDAAVHPYLEVEGEVVLAPAADATVEAPSEDAKTVTQSHVSPVVSDTKPKNEEPKN